MPITINLLVAVLLAASWTDWKYRKIPNILLFISFVISILLHVIYQGTNGLLFSLLGTIVGFALLVIPYCMGGIGAGDVKLLMVVGSFGGIKVVIYSFCLGAIAGGIIASGVYLFNLVLNKNINSLPYGIPLSIGTIAYLFLSGRL